MLMSRSSPLFLKNRKNILVALSGGSDSLFLLYFLHWLAQRQAGIMNLVAAHIQHHIRTEDWQDKKIAQEHCRRLSIPLTVQELHVPQQKERTESMEMAARRLRWQALRQIGADSCCDWIATGHHLQDQVETMILRIGEGTGGYGLQGMSYQGGGIWRPLLYTSKQEIVAYLVAHNLTWAEDRSNQDKHYLRNQVRSLLPHLEQTFPRLQHNLSQLHQNLENSEHTLHHLLQERWGTAARIDEGEAWLLCHDWPWNEPKTGLTVLHWLHHQTGFPNIKKRWLELLYRRIQKQVSDQKERGTNSLAHLPGSFPDRWHKQSDLLLFQSAELRWSMEVWSSQGDILRLLHLQKNFPYQTQMLPIYLRQGNSNRWQLNQEHPLFYKMIAIQSANLSPLPLDWEINLAHQMHPLTEWSIDIADEAGQPVAASFGHFLKNMVRRELRAKVPVLCHNKKVLALLLSALKGENRADRFAISAPPFIIHCSET